MSGDNNFHLSPHTWDAAMIIASAFGAEHAFKDRMTEAEGHAIAEALTRALPDVPRHNIEPPQNALEFFAGRHRRELWGLIRFMRRPGAVRVP